MKNSIIPFFLCFLLCSCGAEVEQGPNFTDPNPNDVEIQVENKSQYLLDSLYLNTSGGDQLYGNLGKRKTSSLKSFRFAYPEMEIHFYISGKKFSHVPVDYSTMTKVENGRYELELDAVDTNNLRFNFILKDL